MKTTSLFLCCSKDSRKYLWSLLVACGLSRGFANIWESMRLEMSSATVGIRISASRRLLRFVYLAETAALTSNGFLEGYCEDGLLHDLWLRPPTSYGHCLTVTWNWLGWSLVSLVCLSLFVPVHFWKFHAEEFASAFYQIACDLGWLQSKCIARVLCTRVRAFWVGGSLWGFIFWRNWTSSETVYFMRDSSVFGWHPEIFSGTHYNCTDCWRIQKTVFVDGPLWM